MHIPPNLTKGKNSCFFYKTIKYFNIFLKKEWPECIVQRLTTKNFGFHVFDEARSFVP